MTKKILPDSAVAPVSPADFLPDEDLVARATEALASVSESLRLRPGLTSKTRRVWSVFWTVSTETVVKAADLATEHGVADFDVPGALAAAAYERRVATVLAEARVLVQRLEDEMTVRHGPHARSAYALFATLKALARIREDDRLAAAVRELGLYLVPARRRKAAEPPPAGNAP